MKITFRFFRYSLPYGTGTVVVPLLIQCSFTHRGFTSCYWYLCADSAVCYFSVRIAVIFSAAAIFPLLFVSCRYALIVDASRVGLRIPFIFYWLQIEIQQIRI